jgi:hypothetical protein
MTKEELDKAMEAQRLAQLAHRDATIKRLEGLSDEALREEQMTTPDTHTELRKLIEIEVSHRALRKHWTLLWGFVVLVITMVFAGIAAWPVVHDWIWPTVKKDVQSEFAPVPRISETPSPLSASPTVGTSLRAQSTASASATPQSEPQP